MDNSTVILSITRALFMDLLHCMPGRLLRRSVWRTPLCFALACLVIAGTATSALRLISRITKGREVFVDIAGGLPTNGQRPAAAVRAHGRLRFAVATMVSAETTVSTYRRFVERVSRDVGLKEGLIVRPSGENVRYQLEHGEVDAALVCTGTYLRGLQSNSIRLLVQPELEQGMTCRSLLVVPSASRFRSWDDLRGAVLAFTDQESFTGYLLPRALLSESGRDPSSYFRKVVYTASHDRSILAVSANYVDAAAVDSLVWASNLSQSPYLKQRLRIIWQSGDYGPPPIVVPMSIDPDLEKALKKELLALHEDEEGRRILSTLGIKRFVPAQPETYRAAIGLYSQYQKRNVEPEALAAAD